MKLKEIEALITPALMPGETIEDFLKAAVADRAGKNGALPSDDLSEIATAELITKGSEFFKHPARLPNLIPRLIMAISRHNDTAPEGEQVSPTNSVLAQLGNIRPNDLTEWMPAYKGHVQEQDEQWGINQFTNRSIGKVRLAELLGQIDLPEDGGSSPKLKAA